MSNYLYLSFIFTKKTILDTYFIFILFFYSPFSVASLLLLASFHSSIHRKSLIYNYRKTLVLFCYSFFFVFLLLLLFFLIVYSTFPIEAPSLAPAEAAAAMLAPPKAIRRAAGGSITIISLNIS